MLIFLIPSYYAIGAPLIPSPSSIFVLRLQPPLPSLPSSIFLSNIDSAFLSHANLSLLLPSSTKSNAASDFIRHESTALLLTRTQCRISLPNQRLLLEVLHQITSSYLVTTSSTPSPSYKSPISYSSNPNHPSPNFRQSCG